MALDALMRERGGVWIAHGSGAADRDVVDAGDCVAVPPDSPSYTLRRIWLTPEEESQYYEGFANEGLWPLCHEAHVRPIFRTSDWDTYQQVNRRFAEVIESELPERAAPVFIQDYHLALVAAALRQREPGVKTALFWHIPWPSPDRLRICPWRRDLLAGLLGNDLIAFQIDRDRRNFLAAAREGLGLDVTRNTVRMGNRIIAVKAVPIGIDYDRIQQITHHASIRSRDGTAPAGAQPRHAHRRNRRRPPRLHEGRARAARRPRAPARAASGPAGPDDLRPDRGPVAVHPAELCGHRRSDRPQGRGHQPRAAAPAGGRSAIGSRPSASDASSPSTGSPTSAS